MEVCVDCVESAQNAERGGAIRLELCNALSEGGLTPTPGFLKVIKSLVKIPVFVMLRPRCGSDFIYSDSELEIMKIDAMILKEAGADGFVFGALTEEHEVNEDICRELLDIIFPLPATFHRAFDVTANPLESLEILIKLGFTRVLTSGQESSAEKGVPLLHTLVSKAENRIIIMPGAGITKTNIKQIISIPGIKEFHASAKIDKQLPILDDKKCAVSSHDKIKLITSDVLVAEMVNIANNLLK